MEDGETTYTMQAPSISWLTYSENNVVAGPEGSQILPTVAEFIQAFENHESIGTGATPAEREHCGHVAACVYGIMRDRSEFDGAYAVEDVVSAARAITRRIANDSMLHSERELADWMYETHDRLGRSEYGMAYNYHFGHERDADFMSFMWLWVPATGNPYWIEHMWPGGNGEDGHYF